VAGLAGQVCVCVLPKGSVGRAANTLGLATCDTALLELQKLKVTRRIVDGSSGRMVPVQEVVEIALKPGWKEGTRIT